MAVLDLFPEKIAHASDDSNSPSKKNLAEYYRKMGTFLDSAYDEAQALQQETPEVKQIGDALDYLIGQQWKEQMPSYRAKPVSNEIMTMFWETIGLLTDVKPMFNISEVGDEFSKTASLLNKLGKGWAQQTRFERKLAFCTMFGMLTSAPAKIYWNPFARGYSGDPSDGDIALEALSTRSIMTLGCGDMELQDEEMVIYRRVRTLEWIRRAFPRMGKMVTPEEQKSKYTIDAQAPVTMMPQMFQDLSPAGKRMMGASERDSVISIYPKAELREFWYKDNSLNESGKTIWMGPDDAPWGYWVKPGKLMYPRGRLTIRANSVTLYDQPNPYFHRKFPFAILGLYAVPWQKYAMSVVSPWMKQQDILNQIMAGLLQCVKKAVNPTLMAPKQAIHPEALRAIDSSKPNLKVTYNGMTATAPTWAQPPNIGNYPLPVYEMVKKSMQATSGMSAMDGAMGKKQVPGGDTLDRITFSKSTPIRHMGGNIEYFVDDIGDMWTADALQFYDAPRRMEMMGAKGLVKEDMDDRPGSLIPDGIASEAYVRKFKYKSDKGTLLNVQRQDKVQIGFALRKNHDLSRGILIEMIDIGIDPKRNDAELMEEAKQMAQAMAAAGVKPGQKTAHK